MLLLSGGDDQDVRGGDRRLHDVDAAGHQSSVPVAVPRTPVSTDCTW